MSVTGVVTTPGPPGAGLSGRPPLLVLPPPMLAPLPQPHRDLDCLVVGGVDRGHTLDRHPLPLQIEITLKCERIFSFIHFMMTDIRTFVTSLVCPRTAVWSTSPLVLGVFSMGYAWVWTAGTC